MSEPMTMTSEQWMDCLAHAWEKGWEACSDFVQDADQDPQFRDHYRNPYRVERAER